MEAQSFRNVSKIFEIICKLFVDEIHAKIFFLKVVDQSGVLNMTSNLDVGGTYRMNNSIDGFKSSANYGQTSTTVQSKLEWGH